uniref:Guanine nucleotide-binding protein-like 1 n=1 Tax=Cynoglossus semilaevis TaxID=244447 RepID=A0A3P8WW86_CYNSE
MPRKKPFSNKQKKKQMQIKRERKKGDTGSGPSSRNASAERGGERQSDTSDSETSDVRRINQQPFSKDGRYDPNRFRLHFERESKEEVEKRKKTAREKPLQQVSEKELELNIEDIYPKDKGLGFPRRPPWNYGMAREDLLKKEEKSFRLYLDDLLSRNPLGSLSHFEHNLETWRQLWRVLEMSDVILLIVDIRHPVLQFPPDLYHYITGDLKKQVIVVLNKIDLCPAPLIIAWKHYMVSQFPDLHTVCFTSQRGPTNTASQKKKRKLDWSHAAGPVEVLKACQLLTAGNVDLSSWEQKIHRDASAVGLDEDSADEAAESVLMEYQSDSAMEMSAPSEELYKNGILTLGCIGFPNVGKSSVINSLVGRKVVSVSRTPGHTKYFQTYYLTPTVKLCDCPGLVFPSRVVKQLQILAGIYPVAQVQEPYSSIGYLCERTNFLSVLKIRHPSLQDLPPHQRFEGPETLSWTAWDVCEGKMELRFGGESIRGFISHVLTFTCSSAIFRLGGEERIQDGKSGSGRQHWETHTDLQDVVALQGRTTDEEEGAGDRADEEEEDDESSSEPEEERDRDADDDDDDDGDDDKDDGRLKLNAQTVTGEMS